MTLGLPIASLDCCRFLKMPAKVFNSQCLAKLSASPISEPYRFQCLTYHNALPITVPYLLAAFSSTYDWD